MARDRFSWRWGFSVLSAVTLLATGCSGDSGADSGVTFGSGATTSGPGTGTTTGFTTTDGTSAGTGTDTSTGSTTGVTSESSSTGSAGMTDPTAPLPECGNGEVEGLEECDDGNMVDDDACTNACTLPICGDLIVQEGEGCDDGNDVDDDACTNTCTLPGCGDGIKQMGEECDDKNDVDDDACTNACTLPKCGDSIVQMSNMEACDDGNADNTDACLDTCVAASCGDGFVHAGVEDCDDKNMVQTDACINTCKAASCGDGFVYAGVEQCDDGNMVDNDACNNMCKVPVKAATCVDILTDVNMWGKVSRGVDLRAWTASTLHYIGCPGDGCPNTSFYCNYNAGAQTIEFGSNSGGAVRSVVDPNNQNGDTMPNTYAGCCNGPLGLCNAPDANNNGVNIGVSNAKALCSALGYADGAFLASPANNSCPEPHATDATGKAWSSDWVSSQGFGQIWKCTGFK